LPATVKLGGMPFQPVSDECMLTARTRDTDDMFSAGLFGGVADIGLGYTVSLCICNFIL
jgi:hypothetical protein